MSASQKQNTRPVAKKITPQEFAEQFAAIVPQVKSVLPAHVTFEKFERVVRLAIRKNPDLLACSPASLFMACIQAASDGLLPDGREGAIVSRWNSKKSCSEASWMPMVAGLMKLARNSGDIASISSQVVFEGELFRVVLGDEERIEHERDLGKTGGKIVAAYAVARLKDGSDPIREIMSWGQIEKIRNTNQKWSWGPWKTWEDEMARKTVIRRLAKRLPMSTDKEGERLQSAIERVDGLVDISAAVDAPQIAADDDFAAAAHGVDPQQIAAPDLIGRLAQMHSLEQVQEIEPQVSQAIQEADERGDSDAANALDAALQSALSRTSTAKESVPA
ncbi:recombinase RecT [Acetobacter sp.]|uniref:recombinase RecT n=1 Tax=Acetobacter sp. TaxID=440 RepID=UPI002582D949|nr:recombinase RecT [Acetobacter sp.]MCC6105934.1 recombinase RecT [Acetobacter sp.]